MRVLFCGGGTAGHVNPALAVAQTVMRNSSDNKVAYVATLTGIENRLVDFKKYQIDVVGLKRSLSLKNIEFAFKQFKALDKCKEIIKEFRPDIIFGTGGYATYPVIVAGKKLGVKTVLHESNVVPGKAILHLEKKVDKIFVNFKESEKYFKCKEKIIHTGNPLRNNIEIGKEEARKQLGIKHKNVILCTSGSLGSNRVNRAAVEIIDSFAMQNKDVLFICATGKNEYKSMVDMLERRGISRLDNVIIEEYFMNLPVIMSASDIVISRAGAMTISELAYLNKASILIPSPNVTNNHQYKNASELEKSGAAILVTEDRLYTLIDVIKSILFDEKKKRELETRISQYGIRDANKRIYCQLLEML